jgi:spore germination cell wall hydrolase CwlJ-like protein
VAGPGRHVLAFAIPALALGLTALGVWLSFSGIDVRLGPTRWAPFATPLPQTQALDDTPPSTTLENLSPLHAEIQNALIPFSRGGFVSPAAYRADASESRDRALACLTSAIYYEAATEPASGQRAVAQVVINRTASAPFPKTICGVIGQGAPNPGCQFTFMCDGSLARAPDAKLWAGARSIADDALNGYVDLDVGGATHYHADYVVPTWATTMLKLVKVGRHIFYRWPGSHLDSMRIATTPPDAVIVPALLASGPGSSVGEATKNETPLPQPLIRAPVEAKPVLMSSGPPEAAILPIWQPPTPTPLPRRAIPDSDLRSGPLGQ